MRAVLPLALLLLGSLAQAEELPSAPQPTFNNADKALFAGIALARVADVISTEHAQAQGAQDLMGETIARSPAMLSGVEAAAMAAQVYGSRWAIRHGHRKLATATEWIHLGATVGVVAWNFSIKEQR